MIQNKNVSNTIAEYLNSEILGQYNITGFSSLSSRISGFRTKQINLFVGETGFGKSNLAVDFACRFAQDGIPTLFFSSEMKLQKTTPRFMANLLDITRNQAEKIHREFQASDDSDKSIVINQLKTKTKDMSLIVEFDRDYPDIENKIRQYVAEYGIKTVFIDHLLILGVSSHNFTDRNQKLTHILTQLELVADELDLCINLVTQFNKGNERGIKRGKRELSDIAGGMDIGHLIENAFYFFETEDQKKRNDLNQNAWKTGHENTIMILKGRNGGTDEVVEVMHHKAKCKLFEIPGQKIIDSNL
jgi:replicative DNA helicase